MPMGWKQVGTGMLHGTTPGHSIKEAKTVPLLFCSLVNLESSLPTLLSSLRSNSLFGGLVLHVQLDKPEDALIFTEY